jgi:hypothetical protein
MKTVLIPISRRLAAVMFLAALVPGCAVYAPPGGVAVGPGYYPYAYPAYSVAPPVVVVPQFRFDYRYRHYR